MKYTVIINSKESETVWNALRFASTALIRGHKVTIFLLGPSVEIDNIRDERFNIEKLLQRFRSLGGETLSCGTCLRLREMNANELCPISSMDELVALTEEADRVVMFS